MPLQIVPADLRRAAFRDFTDRLRRLMARRIRKQTKIEAMAERLKAREDRLVFGTGAVRVDRDGRVTHIPIMELELLVNDQVHTVKDVIGKSPGR